MVDQLHHPASPDTRPRTVDRALRQRARSVIPGGMYGHQAAGASLVARGAYHGAAPWCTPRPAAMVSDLR